MNWTSQR